MALSGSFYNYPYQQFGLYCEWSGTQSATGNYTDILLKVYISYWTLNISERSGSISINGSTSSFESPPIHDMEGGSHKKVLAATTTVRVPHNSDGTKTNVSISATWNCQLTYHQTYYQSITANTNVDLNPIDRSAPGVTHNISSITANGFTISASSSVTADKWEYSVDGGTNYTEFSTAEGTSASVTLNNLSPNTAYSVRVKARRKSNHVYGYSATSSVRTLGGTEIVSALPTYIDANVPVIAFGVTVYDASYYHKLTVKKGSSAIFSATLGKYNAGANQAKSYILTNAQRTLMLNQIPSATSFVATLELASYADSGYTQQVGNASTKPALMLTSQETSRPTFTSFTYKDNRQRTVEASGDDQVLIQNYSLLQVTATAGTAKNGASIAAYSVSIGEVTKQFSSTTMNVGAVSTYGTLALTVSCIDSRGYSTSITQHVDVKEYTKPRISSFSVRRRNEVEASLILSLSGSICEIMADGETQTNALKYVGFYYKRTDSNTWSSYISLLSAVTASGTSFSITDYQVIVSGSLLELDPDYSWDFWLVVRDKLDELSSQDVYDVIPQGRPVLSLRKRNSNYPYPRVGINQPNPAAALDVNGNIMMNGCGILGFVAELGATEDLNDLTYGGIYVQKSGGNTSTQRNYPVAKSGFLEVIDTGTGNILQRYTLFDCTAIYLRVYTRNSWNAWKSASFS